MRVPFTFLCCGVYSNYHVLERGLRKCYFKKPFLVKFSFSFRSLELLNQTIILHMQCIYFRETKPLNNEISKRFLLY